MTTSPTQLRNLALSILVTLSILVAFGLSLSAVQPLVALPLIEDAAGSSVSAPAASDTTTTLTASPNPSTKDEAVTFTATVTSTAGTPNGGVVTLTEGAALATATLVSGVATFPTLTRTIGSHVISATYGGDGSTYNGSSSPAIIMVVNYRPSVATGSQYFCTMRDSGFLDCDGYNVVGQTNVPTTTVPFAQVSAGQDHTCAVKQDGELKCWGSTNSGKTDVPTTTVPFVQVSAGQEHTCALKADGTLACWGLNSNGQTNVPTATIPYVQVSAGYNHSCALKADGTLACWGLNTDHQTNAPPTEIFLQVSAGNYHTCGLKSDQTLVCWGAATVGHDTGQTNVPLPNTNWAQVSAGNYHTCATKVGGTLVCWGGGQDTVPLTYSPFVQVSAGWNATCATKIDKTLACWGSDVPRIVIQPAELHRATIGAPYSQTLTASENFPYHGAPFLFNPTPISGTMPPGITLDPDGTLSGVPTTEGDYGFVVQATDVNSIAGTHDYSMTVSPRRDTTTEIHATPDPVAYGHNVSLVVTVTSAIDMPTGVVTVTDGSIVLGTGILDNAGIAVINATSLITGSHAISATYGGDPYLLGSASSVIVVNVNNRPSVDVGYQHACAVKTDGTLGCWGRSSDGQTTMPTAAVPFVQVSAGNFFNCALTEAGAAVCWGKSSEGQTTVPTMTLPFVQIGTGETHACAVEVDGAIKCWGGSNGDGQTTVPTSTIPYVQVSTGQYHTCALQADGNITCWGRFDEGQTDVPATTVPFVQVSAGGNHTCGLKADRTLVCWGVNNYAQINVPNPNSNWLQVSAGGNNTCGVKVDGTLTCWGENTAGQPIVIPTSSPFAQVGTGWTSTCAVKVDGTIACWGTNDYGQAPVVGLTPTTLPDAPAGTEYAQTIGVVLTTGLQLPFTFDVVSGTLPAGLTLDSASGVLGGTPTSAGTSVFTVRAHDANYLGGTRVYSLTVWKIDTTTTLNSSANPSPLGKVITFTVQVASAVGAPTGVVTLTEASTVLGTSALVNGMTTFTNSSLMLGGHNLQANYSGDTYRNPSIGYLTQMISEADSATTLTSSPNPSIYGQPVTFTAVVTSSYGIPTGVVSFVEGANLEIGTASLVNGVATFISSTLSVGAHIIKASYGGDAHIAASDSTAVTQQVNEEPITHLSATNNGPIASGRTAVLTATIGSGTNVAYQWNFGDGVMGSKAVADHIYVKPGSYTAIVTATNSVNSLSAATLVTVKPGNFICIPVLLRQ